MHRGHPRNVKVNRGPRVPVNRSWRFKRITLWFETPEHAAAAWEVIQHPGIVNRYNIEPFPLRLGFDVANRHIEAFISYAKKLPGCVDAVNTDDIKLEPMAQESVNVALNRAWVKAAPQTVPYLLHRPDGSYLRFGTENGATTFERTVERRGGNVYVAILDGGVDATHDEFTDITVIDVSDQVGDGPFYHATAMASVVAGKTCGLLPDATILNCKAYSNTGGGSYTNIEAVVADLITWGDANLGPNDHMILAMSSGYSSGTGVNFYSDDIAAVESRGWSWWASAGNQGATLDVITFQIFPAQGLPRTGVGAVFLNGERTKFSNYSGNINMWAPGYGVPAAWIGGGFFPFHGTSASCPVAAAAWGTWLAARTPPANQVELYEYLDRYRNEFCNNRVKDRPYLPGDQTGKKLVRADSVTPMKVHSNKNIQVALAYGSSDQFNLARDLQVVLMYD